ncbi:hypothetical protein N7532_006480 [Penicillium argentinense]|uniref:Response regulatory domain-containing protein n=1 Tax=Penicillium argentinense TaxID=1131581 RepID=A0A9W9KAS8_9EURO|nr:uncharacterized protein N7532_006480 [Penicillium argentinense]KAJ5099479.1 hypothetical protein N7532_006480 [Penicillium argentinense]
MSERRLSRLLKAKLLRRSSTSVPKAGNGADPRVHPTSLTVHTSNANSCPPHPFDSASEKSPYSVVSSTAHSSDAIGPGPESEPHPQGNAPVFESQADLSSHSSTPPPADQQSQHRHEPERSSSTPLPTEAGSSLLHTPLTEDLPSPLESPLPTPRHSDDTSFQSAVVKVRASAPTELQLTPTLNAVIEQTAPERRPSSSFPAPPSSKRPSIAIRRQSLLPASHQHLISGLLEQNLFAAPGDPNQFRAPVVADEMVQRRIWVKRPGGSATLVPCLEDAVVDELRDQVIMKYANSLGRTFDSPDIVIRITSREGSSRNSHPERLLSPEESLVSVLDSYYPGGQTVEEALVIDAPTRRTPKPSPRHSVYHHHHPEPGEHGEYFPLMPVNPTKTSTPPLHPSNPGANNQAAMSSIMSTGVPPPLHSPGRSGAWHHRRPPLQRHTTNSPTHLGQAPTVNVTEPGISPHSQPTPAPPQSIPTPPAPAAESPQTKIHTPPAPVTSPRASRKSKAAASPGAVFGGLIDGTVPPINVLIVEDNIINQKLLEAFMKRLSVRWKCAANGEEAVRKWRQGGFHLVLMDIQLPVMNGLDATKEIRRLERLNGIGVFPKNASGRSSVSSATSERRPGLHRSVSEEDTLTDLSLFRSPVIIVALTASSLQSDRHEALAAGCNDFLTKPIGFPWLSQKVTEWGCMQALIDFEGWRKWRGFLDSTQSSPVSLDSGTSPMQTGGRNDYLQSTEPSSPSFSTRASKAKQSRQELARPTLPDAAEIMREDSWGSGSGDTTDTGPSSQATPGESEAQPSFNEAPTSNAE